MAGNPIGNYVQGVGNAVKDVFDKSIGPTATAASKKGLEAGQRYVEKKEAELDKKIAALDENDKKTLKEALSIAKPVLNSVQQSKDNYNGKLTGVGNWVQQRVVNEIWGGEKGYSDRELCETGIANYLKQGKKYELEVISTMLNDPDIKALPKAAFYKLGADAGLSDKQVDLLRSNTFNNALQKVLQQAQQGAVSTEKETQKQGVTYSDISGEEQWRDVDWDAANAGRKFAQLGLQLLQRGDIITKYLNQQAKGPNTTVFVPPEDFEGKLFISKGNPDDVVDARGMSLSVGDKKSSTNLAQVVREYNSIKAVYDKMNNVVNTMDNPKSEQDFLKGFLEQGKTYLTQDELSAINSRIVQLDAVVAQYDADGIADAIKKTTGGKN